MKLIPTKHKEIELMQNDTLLDIRDLVIIVDDLLPDSSDNLKNKFIDRENLSSEPEYANALLLGVVNNNAHT